MPAGPNDPQPQSVARPSEGLPRPVRSAREVSRTGSRQQSDDARTVGDNGRGAEFSANGNGRPKPPAVREVVLREQLADRTAEVAYWRRNYEVMVEILAAQHTDPALVWLDRIVREGLAR